jgi:hypothetical protein
MLRAMLMLTLLTAALVTPGARAATFAGYTLPDTYPTAGQTLTLNGIGIRTFSILSVRVYVAGLYVAEKTSNARAILASRTPKIVLMQFLHAASKSDIEKQYREGETKNCGRGECAPQDEADFEKLIAVTPGAAVGDTLTYICTSTGLRVLFNNNEIANIANPDLALRILIGFIGDKPPSEDLKKHLLGTAG